MTSDTNITLWLLLNTTFVMDITLTQILSLLSDFKCTSSIFTAKYLSYLSLWCVLPRGRGLSAEDLQGMSELGGLRGLEGRSAGAVSVHSAERRLSAHRRESPVTTVWRSAVECPPSSAPSVLFLHNKEDRETGSDWAALDLPPCLRGGGGVVPLSL